MDTDRLQTFRNVARRGSIAAAARLAGCDPSAVSRGIASLEAELGLRLFQRTTRRLELTEAGEGYLRRVEPLIDELAAAREEALGLVGRPRGRLRVTASSAYGQTMLAPQLKSFREQYPDVELEILLTDALVDLVSERVDVALRLGPRPVGDWIVARLASTTMRVVASPEYLRSNPAITVPQEVGGHACLISVPHSRATWIFRQGGQEDAIPVDGAIATSNTLVLKRCALDGLGVSVLADWLIDDDVAEGRLEVILPDWQVAVRNFDTGAWIVYPSRSFLPVKTRAFIDHLRRHVRRSDTSDSSSRTAASLSGVPPRPAPIAGVPAPQ